MDRKYRKRLSVDIPIVLHQELKKIATRRNITMTRLVIRLVIETIKREIELERNN